VTLYRGARTTICHTATVDGVALAPGDVTGVFLTVYAPDWLSVVVSEAAMTWSTPKARWEYAWVADVDPATYHVRVRIEGVDGHSVWQYFRLKVSKDPVLV
jgi:hypothetical protein